MSLCVSIYLKDKKMVVINWKEGDPRVTDGIEEGVDNVLVSAGIELIFTRGWEGTQPGQLIQTSQRDIPYHTTSCSIYN